MTLHANEGLPNTLQGFHCASLRGGIILDLACDLMEIKCSQALDIMVLYISHCTAPFICTPPPTQSYAKLKIITGGTEPISIALPGSA